MRKYCNNIKIDNTTNKVVCEFDYEEFDDLFWILTERSEFIKNRLEFIQAYLDTYEGEPDNTYGQELYARDYFTREQKTVVGFIEKMKPVVMEYTANRPDFEDR